MLRGARRATSRSAPLLGVSSIPSRKNLLSSVAPWDMGPKGRRPQTRDWLCSPQERKTCGEMLEASRLNESSVPRHTFRAGSRWLSMPRLPVGACFFHNACLLTCIPRTPRGHNRFARMFFHFHEKRPTRRRDFARRPAPTRRTVVRWRCSFFQDAVDKEARQAIYRPGNQIENTPRLLF
jgi:hypothetical protein